MCLGNLSPIASRTSTSDLPTRSLAAANPLRSGTVSRSQTMTLDFMQIAQQLLEVLRRQVCLTTFVVRISLHVNPRLLRLDEDCGFERSPADCPLSRPALTVALLAAVVQALSV